MKKAFRALGLMSGTSLDGLDIADCSFTRKPEGWNFQINRAETYKYSENWKSKLAEAQNLNAYSFALLHKEYGEYIGRKVLDFLGGRTAEIDLIASHGHTVFHQPDKKLTWQIGDPNSIYAETGIKTISDFRSLDVALGGQGAPLVPVGDRLLFAKYDFCLNLGGFSNITYFTNEKTYAFDASPANLGLNYLMNKMGEEFDKNGKTGRNGSVNQDLLKKLNLLPYYQLPPPKSLGREWMESEFIPVLEQSTISDIDKLRTVYEHIAIQIAKTIAFKEKGKLLATGGGAHNSFLMERIQSGTKHQVIVPDKKIIDYKEALIFALLGVLRLQNENNCLSSVTGSSKDNSGGLVIG